MRGRQGAPITLTRSQDTFSHIQWISTSLTLVWSKKMINLIWYIIISISCSYLYNQMIIFESIHRKEKVVALARQREEKRLEKRLKTDTILSSSNTTILSHTSEEEIHKKSSTTSFQQKSIKSEKKCRQISETERLPPLAKSWRLLQVVQVGSILFLFLCVIISFQHDSSSVSFVIGQG